MEFRFSGRICLSNRLTPLRMLNSPVPREIDRRAPAMKNRFQPAPRRSASKLSLSSTASQSRQYSVVLTWSSGGSSVPLRIRIVPAITFCRDCFISGSQRLSSLALVGFHYYCGEGGWLLQEFRCRCDVELARKVQLASQSSLSNAPFSAESNAPFSAEVTGQGGDPDCGSRPSCQSSS